MMRRMLLTLLLAAAGFLFATRLAAAAPQDLTRAPDGELRTCSENAKCVARAIGDFNGDGIDDLVFETTVSNARATTTSFDVELSPWVVDSANAALQKPTERGTLQAPGAQSFDPVKAMDVNGDGIDDLVFVTTGQSGPNEPDAAGIHVVLGGTGWKPSGRVDSDRGGTYHFLREGANAGVVPLAVTQEVVFADVNGDGAKDLIVGTDPSGASDVGRVVAQSEVDILLNPGMWRPNQSLASPDARIVGLGPACVGSLVGADDVTGDDRADIVVRQCTDGQPDQLRIVTGRATWPLILGADNGGVTVPRPPDPGPPDPRVPPPGGGYLPSEPDPGNGFSPASFATVEDMNGDGLADAALEFAGKLHVWYGGADIVQRVEEARSSAVILHAGLGAAELTHSWRMFDIDVDGHQDLLLSEPVNLRSVAPDSTGAVLIYTNHPLSERVVDPSFDAPSALWSDEGRVLWGMGDFNGDGNEDLFVGSSPGAGDSIYGWVNGPLTRTSTRFGVNNPGF